MDDDKALEYAAAELHQQTIDLLNRVAAYQIEAARLRQGAATVRGRFPYTLTSNVSQSVSHGTLG
jgi:hypothetical protein